MDQFQVKHDEQNTARKETFKSSSVVNSQFSAQCSVAVLQYTRN